MSNTTDNKSVFTEEEWSDIFESMETHRERTQDWLKVIEALSALKPELHNELRIILNEDVSITAKFIEEKEK